MRTETYICDICKQSKSKDDLAKISIKSEGINMKNVGYGGLQIDVCPDCLKKKGFIVDKKMIESDLESAQLKNKKTLEDKLFDILEDMGVAFVE